MCADPRPAQRRRPTRPSRGLAVALLAAGLLANPWLLGALLGVAYVRPVYMVLIGGVDLACLVAGWALWNGRLRPRHLVFIGIMLAAGLLAAELGVRGFFLARNLVSPRDRDFDRALGWATVANQHVHEELPGFATVDYTTGRDGFRLFGDPATTRTKLLVIGDSYTQGATVSTGQSYPDRIAAARPDVEPFAYGCGGYGTLQEFMALDRTFDTIQPDLILWQFCSNDLFNNDPTLEAGSYFNNNQMTRPYLVDGEVRWIFPYQNFGPLYALVQHSSLLRLLDLRLSSLRAAPGQGIEAELGPDHPLVKRSLATTEAILRRVRRRAGDVPVAAFSVDESPWVPDAFRPLCERVGIHWLAGVPEAIAEAVAAGRTVTGAPYDTHWNAAGHALAAEVLLRDLETSGLLPPAP